MLPLRVCALQLESQNADVTGNLQRAEVHIKNAVSQGTQW